MPLYEYRCDRGHTFEALQSMSDDPLTTCTTCAASVQRVFHPVAVHFKGSGFYTTDYGRRKGSSDSSSTDGKEPSGDSGNADGGKAKAEKSGSGERSGSGEKSGSSASKSGSSD